MKIYLNREERETHLLLLVLWDRLNQWLNSKNSGLSKKSRTNLKNLVTRMIHFSDNLIEEMDDTYASRIMNDAKSKVVTLTSHSIVNLSDSINVSEVSLDTLMDAVQSFYCLDCNKSKQEFKKCPYYQAFLECQGKIKRHKTANCPYSVNLIDDYEK